MTYSSFARIAASTMSATLSGERERPMSSTGSTRSARSLRSAAGRLRSGSRLLVCPPRGQSTDTPSRYGLRALADASERAAAHHRHPRLVEIGHDDVGALAGEPQNQRAPDAAGAARHHGGLAP